MTNKKKIYLIVSLLIFSTFYQKNRRFMLKFISASIIAPNKIHFITLKTFPKPWSSSEKEINPSRYYREPPPNNRCDTPHRQSRNSRRGNNFPSARRISYFAPVAGRKVEVYPIARRQPLDLNSRVIWLTAKSWIMDGEACSWKGLRLGATVRWMWLATRSCLWITPHRGHANTRVFRLIRTVWN